jgi:predicted alpha/beta-hydrolase family hydrolase
MPAVAFLYDGPADARWTLALAHGAGQPMDAPFMTAIAAGVTARGDALGGVRVARFEFPYMAAARQTGRRKPPDREPVLREAWHAATAALAPDPAARRRLLIGGKSLGGRMASLVADEAGVAGLVCLGYPFHPLGKPERLRTAHLEALRAPTLICQGTRDPFGTTEDVAGYTLSPAIRLHWLADGDHGFKPRKASGRTETQNLDEAADAIAAFLAELNAAKGQAA